MLSKLVTRPIARITGENQMFDDSCYGIASRLDVGKRSRTVRNVFGGSV